MAKNNNQLMRSERFIETVKSLEEKIREKAYEIFEGREDHEGDAMSDWLRAKSEVLTSIALEVQEEEDRYVFTGHLPETFEPDEISIDVSDGMFRVAGTHVTESSSKKKGSKSNSRSEVSFLRQVSLPADVDVDGLDTRFDGNDLFVTLPKVQR